MFWNKKKCEKCVEKPIPVKKEESSEEKSYKKMKAFRDVGERFNWLGVDMIVTGHWSFSVYSFIPGIEASYVTKKGELKSVFFYPKELEALKKENPVKKKLNSSQ